MNKALLIVLSFTVGIALFVFMMLSVDINNTVVLLIRDLSMPWLFLSIVAYFATFVLRAWRWKIILIPVRNPVRTSNTFWTNYCRFLSEPEYTFAFWR